METKERLHAILDQLPEGILLIETANGIISYANPTAAQILGLPLTSLIGLPLDTYPQSYRIKRINGRLIIPWSFVVVRALCNETLTSQETLVVRPDGSEIITLSSSAPLYHENEENEEKMHTGAVIMFQDVTAQKSLEQQKNDFLSMISHELRTPLTAIMGYVELLQMTLSNGEQSDMAQTQHALSRIGQQCERLNSLIEEMLDMTRIEHASFQVHFAPRDVLFLLTQVIENQAKTTKKHQLRLVLEGLQPHENIIAYVDEYRIIQVFNNLINNAIKYSPYGGEVEVGLRRVQETTSQAVIWVKDEGIGIPEQELSSIFRQFYRASPLNNSISGLGIGLYLVKEVVTQHQGRVWVESTEGHGSTFYVALPLMESANT